MVYFNLCINLNIKNRPFCQRTSIEIREKTYDSARTRALDLLVSLGFDEDNDSCTLCYCSETPDGFIHVLNCWHFFNPFTELH